MKKIIILIAGILCSIHLYCACDLPNTYLNNLQSTSVTLSWDYVSNSSHYRVGYRVAGSGSGFVFATNPANINPMDTVLNMTGLNPNTAYEWRIRVWCTDGTVSSWSSPESFTTSCFDLTSLPDTVSSCSSSVILTTDPGYVYSWSTGETSQSIDVSQSGDYSVTVSETLNTVNNYSMIFDGLDDNIEVPEINDYESNQHTLSFWYYSSNVSAGDLFSKDGESIGRQWLVQIGTSSDRVQTHVWTSSGLFSDFSSFVLSDNTWYHISQVWDGDSLKLYINGILDSYVLTTGTLVSGDQPLRIGGGAVSSSSPFYSECVLDEVQIWNTALSSQEINNYMNCSPTGNEQGLVGYWNFEEGPGSQVVLDQTLNNNNGIVNGSLYDSNVPIQNCVVCSVVDNVYVSILDIDIDPSSVDICLGDCEDLSVVGVGNGPLQWNLYHEEDFENNVGSEWSQSNVMTYNSSTLLGNFNNDQILFDLNDLPVHDSVKIEFDLYILDSWDGTVEDDQFRFEVDNNVVLHTTFANYCNYTQNYPNQVGGGVNPGQTGAFQIGLPNYNWVDNCSCCQDVSAMYKIERSLAHNDSDLGLEFKDINLEQITDESWAIDNVKIYVYSASLGDVVWSTGEITSTINVCPTQDSTYSVTVTDNFNTCTTSLTVNVNDFQVNLPDTVSSCSSPVTLVADSGYTYSWITGETTQSIDVSQSGNYTLTASQMDCSVNDSVYVSIVDIDIDPINPSICLGDCEDLTVISNGPSQWNLYYEENFENIIGSEWSDNNIINYNSSTVLGNFNNTTVSLNLNNLSNHDSVRVEFDLYVLDSWDGTQDQDIWNLTIDNNSVLNTSFSNGCNSNQSYPDEWPAYNPDYTGATSYLLPNISYSGSNSCANPNPTISALYNVQKSVPHSNSSVNIDFSANGLEGISNESWAIDNVKIYVYSATLGDVLWSTGETNSTINVCPTQDSTYSVTVSDGLTNCAKSLTVTVTDLQVSLPDTLSSCDDFVTLDAGLGFVSYNWSTGESTQTIDVTSSGNYSVTVGDVASNNYSMSFDGTDDYVSFSGMAGSYSDFSFVVKAKLNSDNFNQSLFYLGQESTGNNSTGSIDLTIDDVNYNPARLQVNLNYNHGIVGTQSFNLNTWIDIAGVFDGVNQMLYFYLDGQLIDSTNTSVNNILFTSNDVHKIGAANTGSSQSLGNFFDGNISNLAFFDKQLNISEIQEYMNCAPIGSELGLMGCWNFEEGSGSNVVDCSLNGNNGLVNGSNYDSDVPVQNCQTGCSATDSVYVSIVDVEIEQNDTSICQGDCIDLNVIGNYGNPGFISGFTYGGFYNGSYYYISDSFDSWTNAQQTCSNLGGHLVTFSDASEQNFVNSIVSSEYFIGLYQNTASSSYSEPLGGWEWVTGENLIYTDWNSGEPNNNTSGEDYAISYPSGGWNDGHNGDIPGVGSPHYYVLEIESSDNTILWSLGAPTSSITVCPSQTTTYVVSSYDGVTTCYDSVTVIVNQADTSYLDVTACDSYDWNGNTYDASGTYYYNGSTDNNYSIYFDNTIQDYIDIDNNISLNNLNSLSFSFWINSEWSNSTGQEVILDWGGVGGCGSRYVVKKENNELHAWFEGSYFNSSNNTAVYDMSSYSNSYVYVTVTINNSTTNIFINGDLKSSNLNSYTGDFSFFPDDASCVVVNRIGFHHGQNVYEFKGNIDELTFWSRELTSQEINNYMNCSPSGDESGLVGYWNFEEGSGVNVYDLSFSGYNGFLYNSPTFSSNVPAQSCQLTTVNGCDSISVLDLTINNSDTSYTDVIACGTYDWNGAVYDSSGSYDYVTQNAAGCDSTAILNLTINSASSSTTTVTACDTYDWNGTTYTASGSYDYVTQNSAGCDSTATLNLIINQSDTSYIDITACDSYDWNGATYTSSGSYFGNTFNNTGNMYSLNFDYYNSDQVELAHSPFGGDNNYFTIMAWINPDSLGQDGIDHNFYLHATGGSFDNKLMVRNDSIVMNLFCSGTKYEMSYPISDYGEWMHVAYTASGANNNLQLWVNGVNVDNIVLYNDINWGSNFIYERIGGSGSYHGKIDEVLIFNSPLSQSEIQSYMCDVSLSNANLIHYWDFEEGSGSVVYDQVSTNNGVISGASYISQVPCNYTLSSSNGCDSTVVLNLTINNSDTSYTDVTSCDSYYWNGVTYSSTGTYYYNGLSNTSSIPFDGVRAVEIDPNFNFNSNSGVTVTMWVKNDWTIYNPNSYGLNECLFSFECAGTPINGSSGYVIGAGLDDNGILCAAGCNYNIANQNQFDNEWIHLAFTYTVNSRKFYVNGQEVASDNTTDLAFSNILKSTGDRFMIGQRFTGAYYYGGLMDDFKLYGKGLSNQEILDDMNCLSSQDLIAHWNFDEGSGSMVYDNVNNINGNIINSSSWDNDVHSSCTYGLSTVNGCDSTAVLNLTINNSNTGIDTQTACDTYTWIDGNTYTSSNNTATYILTNAAGCDSVVTLDLTMNNSSSSTTNITACDSYDWNGTTYTSSGSYDYVTQNSTGCDSVATLNLTINQSDTSYINITACDSYDWNGNTYTSSGTYYYPMNSVDTLFFDQFTMNFNSSYNYSTPNTINGAQYIMRVEGSWTMWSGVDQLDAAYRFADMAYPGGIIPYPRIEWGWNGITPSSDTIFFRPTPDTYNNSHIYWFHFTGNGNIQNFDFYDTFYGDNSGSLNFTIYEINNTLTNLNGCDSTVVLNLTINNSNTGIDTQTACDTYTWIDGNTYTSSNNTATYILTNAAGCDSVVTLDLTMNNSSSSTTNITACDSYDWNGNTYTSSGSYDYFTQNANGCDSVATLNLTINNSNTGIDTQTACDTYTWIDGNTYTSSNNTATYTLTNSAGCDSVVTLDLTINNTINYSQDVAICDGDIFTVGNSNYSSAGSYIDILTANSGCDSIVVTNLSVSDIALSILTYDATCNGINNGSASVTPIGGIQPYLYDWGTLDPNALSAGNYSVIVTDNIGCSETINFTISEPNPLQIILSNTDASCNGLNNGTSSASAIGGTSPYIYTWGGYDNNSLLAGNYTAFVQDANGCVNFENFVISQPNILSSLTSSTSTLCYGDSTGTASVVASGGTAPYLYDWGSFDPNTLSAGTYFVNISDTNGCSVLDSVIVSQPSLLQSTSSTVDVSCYGLSDGSASVNGVGGTSPYIYNWSSLDSSALSSGSYAVEVIDNNGCLTIENFVVNQPDSLVLTIDSIVPPSCDNGICDGYVILSATGGNQSYTFNYTGFGNTYCAGNYTVSVWDNLGCFDHESFTMPNPSIITAQVNTTNPSCYGGNNGTANLVISGGAGGYQVNWNGEDPNFLSAGNYDVVVTDANGCYQIFNYTINNPIEVNVNSNINNVSCFGISDGSIDLLVSGGSSPYSYSWSNGEIIQNISNLGVGTYDVIVADSLGCFVIESFNISEPTEIIASSFVSDISCFGSSNGSIDISVSGGSSVYNFNWSNGAISEDVFNLSSGYYTLNITDSSGCSIVDSFLINTPSEIILSSLSSDFAGFGVSCSGASDGFVDLTVSGGTNPYTYLWNTGDTTQNIDNLVSGSYSCIVTDFNGCDSTVFFDLTEPQSIQVNLLITNALCYGDSTGAVSVNVSGGASPYNYDWFGFDPNYLSAGTYDVLITDSNGCFTNSQFSITEPDSLYISNINVTNAICYGQATGSVSVNGIGGIPNYNTIVIGVQNNNSLNAGNYQAILVDQNGCTSDTSLFVISQPPQLQVNYNTYNVLCNGGNSGSVSIINSGGTPPYFINWNSINNPNSLIAGNYNVYVSDALGCSDSINFIITEPNPITVNISPFSQSICDGDTAIISAQSGFLTYNWSNGDNSEMIYVDSPGIYYVTVTDSSSCTGYSDSVIVNLYNSPSSNLIIGDDFVEINDIEDYCVNGSINSNYQWGFVAGSINSGQGTDCISLSFNSYGTYDLWVVETSVDGCLGDTLYLSITVTESVNINDLDNNGLISIFPNPFYDFTTVKIHDDINSIYSFKLIDSRGKLVRIYNKVNEEFIITRGDLNSGVYYLHVLYKNNELKILPIVVD